MSRMSIGPAEIAGTVFVGILPIALSLTFFYAVTPLDHRWVARGRRAILKNDYRRWPFRNAWPGLLPIGIGIELLLIGRVTAAYAVAAAGPGAGFASALAVASDGDWQALVNASDALLTHLTKLHDAISRDLPRL
jgi:hypothetical protein